YHLRYGGVVGGRREAGPRRRVAREFAGGACHDRVAAGTPLVLAHVGEQGPVIEIPGRIQPVTAALDPAGVIDVEPRPRTEPDRVEADLVRSRSPARCDQQLVGAD